MDPNGPDYQIVECDVSVTSGWFWKQGKVPQSSKKIASIYFTSVCHGQLLLLNVPPDTEGKNSDNFVEALEDFTKTRTQSFSHDFARQIKVIDFGEHRTFDLIMIQEHIQLGQRISKFKIEVHKKSSPDNEWTLFDEAQTIGYRH